MKEERLIEVPIDLIKKLDNSRLRIGETDLVPLMEDIKHRGLLQPIGIIQEGSEYILAFGNRRLEACKKLGWKTIPALLRERELNEDSFMADNIAENIHRIDLTPVELANQCKSFLARGYNLSEISALLSIPKKQIISSLSIEKNTPALFKKMVDNIKHTDRLNKKGKISVTVANEILSYSNYLSEKQKESLFEEAKKNELSGGQIRLIKNMMRHGMSLEQAMNQYKNFKMCTVEFPLRKEELEKYELDLHKLFKGFLDGSVKPNKKLLVDFYL